MNLSAGFRAAGEGLQLIAGNVARREEREWEALRQENLENLRHQHNLEGEGVRAKNEADAAGAHRTFIAGENEKNRKADKERQDSADRRADARQRTADSKQDSRDLAELRRHRSTTLQNFRMQYSKALDDYNKTKASGVADETDLAELRDNIQYISREMQDFDAQSKDALAAAGDPWAKAQQISDEGMEKMMGGQGDATGKPSARVGVSENGVPIAREQGDGAARGRPKTKPMGSQSLRDTKAPRPNPIHGDAGAVASWAAGADSAAAQQRRQEEEQRQRQSYSTRPTAAQLATASHSSGPRLIP